MVTIINLRDNLSRNIMDSSTSILNYSYVSLNYMV